jgi:hypothetical protein
VAALFIPGFSPATAYTLAVLLIFGSLIAIFFMEGAPYERQAKIPKTFSA